MLIGKAGQIYSLFFPFIPPLFPETDFFCLCNGGIVGTKNPMCPHSEAAGIEAYHFQLLLSYMLDTHLSPRWMDMTPTRNLCFGFAAPSWLHLSVEANLLKGDLQGQYFSKYLDKKCLNIPRN